MKIKALHRITALIMAFLMFFSSVGYSINVHYCKGELKSLSLIGEAASCHSAKKLCPHHAKSQIEEDKTTNCCSNETLQVEDLDIDYNISQLPEFSDLELKFVTAFVYAFSDVSVPKVTSSSPFKICNQLPTRDIYVLLESYLL
jgi:hypothetical protein